MYITVFAAALQVSYAVTFIIASVGKFVDLRRAAVAISMFGVSQAWSLPAAVTVASAEYVTGISVLLYPENVLSFMAVAGLLVTMSIAIVLNLRLGRRPICNCFGEFSLKVLSWRTVSRNLALLVGALLSWRMANRPVVTTIPGLGMSRFLCGALLLIGSIAWIAALRCLRMRSMKKWEPRWTLPHVASGEMPGDEQDSTITCSLDRLGGSPIVIADVIQAVPDLLLIFTDAECRSCDMLMPAVRRAQRGKRSALPIIVISRGSPDQVERKARSFRLWNVLSVGDPSKVHIVARQFNLKSVPSCTFIEGGKRGASSPIEGAERVLQAISGLKHSWISRALLISSWKLGGFSLIEKGR